MNKANHSGRLKDRVMWSDEAGKALAECVSQPEGFTSSDVWLRDTPQPLAA